MKTTKHIIGGRISAGHPNPYGSVGGRIAQLIREHFALIEKTRTELATNFDAPAGRIIGIACGKMGIQRSEWDAIQRAIVQAEGC